MQVNEGVAVGRQLAASVGINLIALKMRQRQGHSVQIIRDPFRVDLELVCFVLPQLSDFAEVVFGFAPSVSRFQR